MENGYDYKQAYVDTMDMLFEISVMSPEHGNALMDIMGEENFYEMLKFHRMIEEGEDIDVWDF